jgi:hypothetical protein
VIAPELAVVSVELLRYRAYIAKQHAISQTTGGTVPAQVDADAVVTAIVDVLDQILRRIADLEAAAAGDGLP